MLLPPGQVSTWGNNFTSNNEDRLENEKTHLNETQSLRERAKSRLQNSEELPVRDRLPGAHLWHEKYVLIVVTPRPSVLCTLAPSDTWKPDWEGPWHKSLWSYQDLTKRTFIFGWGVVNQLKACLTVFSNSWFPFPKEKVNVLTKNVAKRKSEKWKKNRHFKHSGEKRNEW